MVVENSIADYAKVRNNRMRAFDRHILAGVADSFQYFELDLD